ncbi:pilus assembly protein PilO [Scytonema sp. NUACC26]|uniref:pilus assembly protein PilO n=1 Tax=Scytonema sp. NUACC26 TaxID=3140176 RepID=UPI0034DC6FD0
MTVSEDISFEQGGDFGAASAPSYPVVFGISLTPKVSGIIVGCLGIAGAAFMAMNMLMPSWDMFQQQQTKQTELQTDIEQKKVAIKQIGKIQEEQNQAKVQQVQVMGLFANEKTLDTLLLDLNRLVESGNSQIPFGAVRAKLKKYAPTGEKAEPITDGTFGPLVDGKLKRRSINIEIIGTYEQTQSILRNIERLQPLLLVKDYQAALAPETADEPGKKVRRIGPKAISTNFQIQALMPMTPQDTVTSKQ